MNGGLLSLVFELGVSSNT